MQLDLYDRFGDAIAYSEDTEHIYLFTGEAISYLSEEAIYRYRGDQLGWYENGWVRDKHGRCVAFSPGALDGPRRAAIHALPAKFLRQIRPSKEPRDPRTLRPIHSNAWSEVSAKDFFSIRSHRWPGGGGSL